MKLRPLIHATLVLAGLAGIALVLQWREDYGEGPGLEGRPLLDTGVHLKAADILLMETAGSQTTLRREHGEWVVAEQAHFPADLQRIHNWLWQLRDTRIGPRIPAAKEDLGRLGLLQKHEHGNHFEAGVTAAVFTVIETRTGRDKGLYQLLIGNPRAQGEGTYVRFPGDRTAYVVDRSLSLHGEPAYWIRHRVLPDAKVEALTSVRVWPERGPAFRLHRAEPEGPWQLEGRSRPPSPKAVRDLLDAVAGLRVTSAAPPADPPAPTMRPRLEARFRAGWTLALRRVTAGNPGEGAPRVLISATLDTSPKAAPAGNGSNGYRLPDATERRVQRINHHYARRALPITAEQAALLFRGAAAYLAPSKRPDATEEKPERAGDS